MIILDSSTKKLEINLGSVPTSELPWVANWADHTLTTFVAAEADGLTNGTTPVTVVAGPATGSTQRQVKFLSVHNLTAARQKVTVQVDNSGAKRIIHECELAPGDQLHYIDSDGFKVLDSNGALRTALSSGSASTLETKSGTVLPGAFSGFPKKATVVFSVAYSSAAYAVTLSPLTAGVRTYAPSVENKTASGFDVNLHSYGVSDLVEIDWHTIETGEE
jgi:hypothetical protein